MFTESDTRNRISEIMAEKQFHWKNLSLLGLFDNNQGLCYTIDPPMISLETAQNMSTSFCTASYSHHTYSCFDCIVDRQCGFVTIFNNFSLIALKKSILFNCSLERFCWPQDFWLLFQMQAFICLLLVGSVASLDLIGRTQSAAVKGKLMCEGKPASGVKVKLMEADSERPLGIQKDTENAFRQLRSRIPRQRRQDGFWKGRLRWKLQLERIHEGTDWHRAVPGCIPRL